MIARLYAPCGSCGALVPRVTGCVHWRPGVEGRRVHKNKVEALRRQNMSPEQLEIVKARNRAAAARSRERAKLASGGVVL